MCTKDVQTVVYPDGKEREEATITRCSKAPAGYECAQPRVFTYPKVYKTSSDYTSRYPPTPRLTPSGSPRPTTPRGYEYASGGESSDHSRRSGGSSGSSRRRDRYTSYHGSSPSASPVININRASGSGRQERILIVENPPTPRTPPQAFAMPFTAPSSPRSGYAMAADHYGSRHDRYHGASSSSRPVIVDERRVRFGDDAGPAPFLAPGHRRTRSGESSSRPAAAHSSDDERRASRRSLRQEHPSPSFDASLFPESAAAPADSPRRRRDRRAAAAADMTAEERKLDRDLLKAARIAQMNSHIESRSAVPVPGLNRTTTDVAAEQRERELREAVRDMNIGPAPGLRRRDTGMRTPEEEAQKRRLEERLMPRRRATVGPGSRRGRAVYENGVYVWE